MDLVYEELEDCIPTNSMEKEIEYNELVKELNMFLENLSKQKKLNIKLEEKNITILHNVFFSFLTIFSSRFNCRFITILT